MLTDELITNELIDRLTCDVADGNHEQCHCDVIVMVLPDSILLNDPLAGVEANILLGID